MSSVLHEACIRFDFKDYIETNFDYIQGSDPNAELRIDCISPECDDHWKCGKHMYVYFENNHSHCFKCGLHIDLIDFLKIHEKLSFFDASRRVLGNVPKYESGGDRLSRHLESIFERKIDASPTLPSVKRDVSLPLNVPIGFDSLALDYLKGRGFGMSVVNVFDLRYCPFGSDMAFRLLIPVYYLGGLVGYQGRDITGESPRKYMFPSGAGFSNYFYNWDSAVINLPVSGELIIVEGVTDCWRVWLAGVENVVASFGKSLKINQRKLLLGDDRIKSICFFWDGNAKVEAYKVAEDLASFKPVRVVELPDGMEPDNCPDIVKTIRGAVSYRDLSRLQVGRKLMEFRAKK